MDIGILSAFLGGILALLSPCAALLMPAFFASTVGAGPRLLAHGAVFYLGLLLVLVPLGIGAGAVGALFATHRQAIVLAASVLLLLLGVAQALGFGFDPARLLPGAAGLQTRATTATGWLKTLLLGSASGIAGFCAGPILGAVLTLAAAQGDMIVLGRELHTTTVLTGLLIVGVGVLFWTTNGLVGAPELLPLDAQAWLQERSAVLADPVLDVAVIGVLAALVLLLWARRRRTRSTANPPEARPGKTP